MIGAFLVGRPFPLFRQLFHHAAQSGNILYGAAAFSLQAIGNMLIMSLLYVLVFAVTGNRLHRWIACRPSRWSAVAAAAFLVTGVLLLLYWDVRILARFDLIWYPMAPCA
ncbi:hypothetical protein [Streptomyces sp. NPDC096152]|uniref:hypothetical protein n=1 Tax=Streptomyces sp. NPDC096152 TaxID=3366078 RepID=UPI0037FBE2AD